MSAAPKAKIEIDVCEEHGVWLDHGELGVIVQHIRDREATRKSARGLARKKDMSAALAVLFPFLFDSSR